jgi:hypothetical protein
MPMKISFLWGNCDGWVGVGGVGFHWKSKSVAFWVRISFFGFRVREYWIVTIWLLFRRVIICVYFLLGLYW